MSNSSIAATRVSTLATAGLATVVIAEATQPWHIVAFVLAIGISSSVGDPARISMLPNIIPKSGLTNALALNSVAYNATRLLLPALAGSMIAVIGAGQTLALGVGMFFTASLAVLGVSTGGSARSRSKARLTYAELSGAFHYVRGTPPVLALLLLRTIPIILIFPFVVGLMPVFASDVFKVGPEGLGLLLSAMGAGALLAALAVATKGAIRHTGRVLLLSSIVTVGAMATFAVAPTMALALPALVLHNAGFVTLMIVANAGVQTLVPDEIRGRITALWLMTWGLVPFGSLLAGGLAEILGAPMTTMVAAVAITGLLAATAVRFRSIWGASIGELDS